MKLSVEKHLKQHEDCIKILEMIEKNRRYMLSDMGATNHKSFMLELYGRNYYTERIEMRKKIQARLLTYYAKKVAMIGSESYEVAMEILKPNLSNQNQ